MKTIRLADAAWGTYGEVTGWGADGTPTTHAGFISRLPEIDTPRQGAPLLSFAIERPRTPTHGRVYMGMYAPVDAVLRLLPPPPDSAAPDPWTDAEDGEVAGAPADVQLDLFEAIHDDGRITAATPHDVDAWVAAVLADTDPVFDAWVETVLNEVTT